MKKIAVVTIGLAAIVGTSLLFGQQAPSASANRYSAEVVNGGSWSGLSITDHVENKHYFYIEKDDKYLELQAAVDLTKAGQQRIEYLPTTRPVNGG